MTQSSAHRIFKTEWLHKLQAALVAGLLFNSHFVRRALEVIYINDYTGTWERDSRFELLYYVLWGLLAGSASGKLPLQVHGVAAPHIRLLGMCLCIIGQCGNSWCHLELRRLRKQREAIGTSTYIIPSRGPFAYVSTPHYTFELLTWFGYALHQGLDITSLLLIALSAGAMGSFAIARHAKYVQLYKEGDRTGGDPAQRWKMVPGIW